jgi:NAD(P)-dependent dehydrogenase (short-subunit alcohol dehydrogenase family)
VALDIPDNLGLTGKVAVVTGGGAAGDGIGNGRAACILLARAGAHVVVVDLDRALAERTVSMIEDGGGKAVAVQADVTKAADCAAVVKTALDRFGRLDLLDNNVGISSRGTVVDETEESWRRVMHVNVDSMYLMAKHAIPAMRQQGGGAIVNVSSISALRPRGLTVYTVSKGAVIALTRAMAVDHGRENIRVNCVAPGPVYTPMVYQRGMTPAARDRRRQASALGVEGTGWDIGHAVRFLLSDHARYITGHTLVVDGGLLAQQRSPQVDIFPLDRYPTIEKEQRGP